MLVRILKQNFVEELAAWAQDDFMNFNLLTIFTYKSNISKVFVTKKVLKSIYNITSKFIPG